MLFQKQLEEWITKRILERFHGQDQQCIPLRHAAETPFIKYAHPQPTLCLSLSLSVNIVPTHALSSAVMLSLISFKFSPLKFLVASSQS